MLEKYRPVTHVIFDMDGLLLNTEPRYEIAISNICTKFGSSYTLDAKLKTMGKTATDGAKTVIANCNLPITVDEFLSLMDEQFPTIFKDVEFMPGAEKLVKHLAQNDIPMEIATSSKGSTFKLKSKGKEEFFSKFENIVIGSDDPEVKHGKPSPDIFLIAANRFSRKPEDMGSVLVFEDSISGVKAGLAAGMQVVWVPAPFVDSNSQEATLKLTSLEGFKPELFHLPPFNE